MASCQDEDRSEDWPSACMTDMVVQDVDDPGRLPDVANEKTANYFWVASPTWNVRFHKGNEVGQN